MLSCAILVILVIYSCRPSLPPFDTTSTRSWVFPVSYTHLDVYKRQKQLHDEYTETPEYMALLRGALSMMKVSHIDLLVVGLPVVLFAVKKAAFEKAMTGRHDIGGGKAVTVGKAMVDVYKRQPQVVKARPDATHGRCV